MKSPLRRRGRVRRRRGREPRSENTIMYKMGGVLYCVGSKIIIKSKNKTNISL